MSAALQLTRPNMTDAEWQARCDLAALYHIVNYFGWTDTINTHMSARIPGEPKHFLINRYGEMFDEITASSLIKMDMDGNVLGAAGKFNNAGFTIHSGVYKARPDANCVLHTHTRAGAGISLLDRGLRPISQDALHVLDDVAYHPYGVPATVEECEALGRTCAAWKLRGAAEPRVADLRPDDPWRADAVVHAGARLRTGTDRAHDGCAAGDDRAACRAEGGGADAEDPQHRGLWLDGMEGPGAHGGAQGRRLPPLIGIECPKPQCPGGHLLQHQVAAAGPWVVGQPLADLLRAVRAGDQQDVPACPPVGRPTRRSLRRAIRS